MVRSHWFTVLLILRPNAHKTQAWQLFFKNSNCQFKKPGQIRCLPFPAPVSPTRYPPVMRHSWPVQ